MTTPNTAAAIEPLLKLDDIARALNCCRRSVESMRSSGRLPKPDFHVGRSPRWEAETIRQWKKQGGSK